ncbi:hypothetical protein FHP29_12555 [Nocardioides albidus]|uniref:Hydrolytic protein n=1 Tax=Nocardioides albidus TaxID=1517589 RepID=A0A5C4VV88_9ACTN|nr:hypothetical protein [Nocardioides albidus]TNM39691.1 hypothetical protein FHP29_12555 [Nocardioides albidus]
MTTIASLDSTSVRLDPGAEAVIPLQIRNNGTVVEGYELSVIGVPADWAIVEPSTVSLYPGTATTATVTFRPPRSARTPAGEHGFGVSVLPTEHPEHAVVPEGTVELLPFLETTAEVVPRTSQGRRGRHQVAIDNRGNVPVNVMVRAASDGGRLALKVDPVGLEIPPGEARFARISARSPRPIWRGQPVTHPFIVEVAPERTTPVELDATYVQTPVVPKWLLWLLVGLLALALVLATLWFTLLKPTIESQARDAVGEAVADAQQAAGEAKENAESANKSATDAQKSVDKVAADKEAPPSQIISDQSKRLHVVTAGSSSDQLEFEDKSVFRMTDVVLSNPQGDFGRAQLLVDGDIQMDVALENFRDLDFHFVSPVVANKVIRLDVTCRTPGTPPDDEAAKTCDVSALIGGELSRPAPQN